MKKNKCDPDPGKSKSSNADDSQKTAKLLSNDSGIKRSSPYGRNAKKSEQIIKIVDVFGKLALGLAGVGFGYLFHTQQQQMSRQFEEARRATSQSQLILQKNQFAANLTEPLLKGSESEKLISMTLLKEVDEPLALKVSRALALHDPNVNVRLSAIEALADTGVSDVRQTLETLTKAQEEGITKEERTKAQEAKDTVKRNKLEELVKKGKNFFEAGRQRIAADFFYEALDYADDAELASRLALAKSHYEHGGYEEAAREFYDIFVTQTQRE